MNSHLATILVVLGSAIAAQSQQQPAPVCPNVESLRLPDESAKKLSEYAHTVADSVSRSWNVQNDVTAQKPWSVLARAGISEDGQLSTVTITNSSGDTILDKSVSDTIRRASPFPALPSEVDADCVAVGLNFSHAPGQKVFVTTDGGVYRVGGGVSAPRAIYSPDPQYTKEAQKAKFEGIVVLSLIVTPRGEPRDIRVVRNLGMGLDEKAIEAVRRWKFEPAMKDGKPVAVAINVQVTFRLY